jgi:hypothetical protein
MGHEKKPDETKADATKGFEQWCVIEMMGHQSVVGRCSEEQVAGATLLRVDVPDGDSFTTQYLGGGSIFRIRIVSEDVARRLAATRRDHTPPFVWELSPNTLTQIPVGADGDGS